MSTETRVNTYPSWVYTEGKDPARVFDEYEEQDRDPHGSDLYVESYSDRLAHALEMRRRGRLLPDRTGYLMVVQAGSLLEGLEEEAQTMRDELKVRLDELSESDRLYAQAVQDWTTVELQRRIEDRGYDYDMMDERAYLEMIDVLETLVGELEQDEEDEALVLLASTWRDEVAAELMVQHVRDSYRLAA